MTANPNQPGVSRRTMVKALTATGFCAAMPGVALDRLAVSRPEWKSAVTAYLEGLSRPDGGYAWQDQPHSHLTPTFAVIGSCRALEYDPPDRRRLAEFVRTHHPS
ncbi:MAG: hypothetical protein JSW66_05475, partial [Phycisphaerales bacterium]